MHGYECFVHPFYVSNLSLDVICPRRCRYKFDDERVTKEDVKRALEEQYGGEEEVIFLGYIPTALTIRFLSMTKYLTDLFLSFISNSCHRPILVSITLLSNSQNTLMHTCLCTYETVTRTK